MPRIYTIGYGQDLFDEFLTRIQPLGITHIVDVRTNAWSRYQPDFRAPEMGPGFASSGLKYIFMGDRLGGKPPQPEVYDGERLDADKLLQQDWFLEGLDRLERAAQDEGKTLLLMCGCTKPHECHRGRILGPILDDRGIEQVHVLPDGSTMTQAQVDQLTGRDQLKLF